MEDSLKEISEKQKDLKKKLKISFVGEPGLDMGGLTKEWFQLLIRKIFDPDYGMFVYFPHSRCYWFSVSKQGNLREYNLIGDIFSTNSIAEFESLHKCRSTYFKITPIRRVNIVYPLQEF